MTGEQRARWWVAIAVVFVALLYLLRDILLPFVAGMAVAYFLDPLADRLERAGLSRTWATTIITAGFFIVVLVLLIMLLPVLQNQFLAFVGSIPGYIESAIRFAMPLLETAEEYLTDQNLEQLRNSLSEYLGTVATWAGGLVTELVTGSLALFNLISLLFITPVVAFYLLRDWDRMVEKVDSWLPRERAEVIREQFREIDRTLAGFVRGQATVCLVLGAFYGIALTAAGLKVGLMVGLLSGLISFIPYLGSITGFVLGVVLAYFQTGEWLLPVIVAAIFLFGQMIEGNFLTPKLVGDRVGLHPVWVIFALLAGATLFGFVGILLAVPVAAVIGVLLRFTISRYMTSPLYRQGERQPVEQTGAAERSDVS